MTSPDYPPEYTVTDRLRQARQQRRLGQLSSLLWILLGVFIFVRIDTHSHSASDTLFKVVIIWSGIGLAGFVIGRFILNKRQSRS